MNGLFLSPFLYLSILPEFLGNPETSKEDEPVFIEASVEVGLVAGAGTETEAEVDLKKLLQLKEAEIEKLRKDWSEAEKYLRIQMQVADPSV